MGPILQKNFFLLKKVGLAITTILATTPELEMARWGTTEAKGRWLLPMTRPATVAASNSKKRTNNSR